MTGSPRARHFEAVDTPDVRAALEGIASIVLAHGGAIHPGAQFVERGGDLTVRCTGGRDGDLLFSIPHELLIPVTGAVWAKGTTMRLLEPPCGLTAIRRELLDLYIELYSAAGKLDWARRALPRVALPESVALVAAIATLRPGFRLWGKTLAEAFLETRVISISQGESDPVSVIMPLIETANHHVAGAPFGSRADGLHLVVARVPGSSECYADYGARRDALDLMLDYGYVDRTVRVVRSGQVSVTVPPVGQIDVGGRVYAPRHALDPPTITRTNEGLSLSHLTFHADHPERVNGTLGLAVRSAALAAGATETAAGQASREAVSGIMAANLEAIGRIVDVLEADQSPAGDMVKAACLHQAEVIERVAVQLR